MTLPIKKNMPRRASITESEMKKFIFKVKSKKEVYLLNVFIQSYAIVKDHCGLNRTGFKFLITMQVALNTLNKLFIFSVTSSFAIANKNPMQQNGVASLASKTEKKISKQEFAIAISICPVQKGENFSTKKWNFFRWLFHVKFHKNPR
jgi:hypothetical protein